MEEGEERKDGSRSWRRKAEGRRHVGKEEVTEQQESTGETLMRD